MSDFRKFISNLENRAEYLQKEGESLVLHGRFDRRELGRQKLLLATMLREVAREARGVLGDGDH